MSYVKDFGAMGDGAHDDTEAIRHCLADGDGTLCFSRGTYRITAPIEVMLNESGRTAISGDGGVATLLMDGPGPALRLVGTHDKSADPESFRPGVWVSERMPTVTQIEIVGGHDESIGIQLEGVMQATISGVLIRRCRIGVHLVKRNRNLLLANSHIYDGRGAAIGVYFDGVNLHQTNIVGCHISYQGHAGIKVKGSEIRNLQITGCDIEYNFEKGVTECADIWIDAREGTVREGTISSCTIQAKRSPGGVNVRIEGLANEQSTSAGLWTISGNVIQSQATNLLLRSCRAVVVTGNSFCAGFEHSIVIEKCRNIVIGSNALDFNPDYGGERIDGIVIEDSSGVSLTGLIVEAVPAGNEERGGAIEVVRSSEIHIANCQILDSVYRGLDLQEVQNSQVTGCSVLARKPNGTLLEAIRTRDCGRDLLLQGNLLSAGKRGEIVAEKGEPTRTANTSGR